MIKIRKPQDIYQIKGEIGKGTFQGCWHFSFDQYYDPEFIHFGTLRVFNDDTLSPQAVWPLHSHRENEVVTYCVEGEFRHADSLGGSGILKKGWVQHTTIGRGMYHSKINNQPDRPMRFIQMWFFPDERNLSPKVSQKKVEKKERMNRFLPLVSNKHATALPIHSDARIFAAFLQTSKKIQYQIEKKRGVYLYVLEGGPIQINDNNNVAALTALMVTQEDEIRIEAKADAELLLIDVFFFDLSYNLDS